MLDTVHIRIFLQLTHHCPLFFENLKEISLHFRSLFEETFRLINRIIVIFFPVRHIVAFFMERPDFLCHTLHQFYIFIINAVKVNTVFAELGNLQSGLIDIDICIIGMCLCTKLLCYTFVLTINKELCAVSGEAEDILFAANNEREQNIGESFFKNYYVINVVLCAVKDLTYCAVDSIADTVKEQAVNILNFLDRIEFEQEIIRIFANIHIQIFRMTADELLPEQSRYTEIVNFFIHIIQKSA